MRAPLDPRPAPAGLAARCGYNPLLLSAAMAAEDYEAVVLDENGVVQCRERLVYTERHIPGGLRMEWRTERPLTIYNGETFSMLSRLELEA